MRQRARYVSVVLSIATAVAWLDNAQGEPRGYVYQSKNKAGEVDWIVFDGDAEWLAKQDDSRSHFHELPHLCWLSLKQHRISVAEMTYIVGLKNIKTLDVGRASVGFPEEEVEITSECLALVERMPWLEELEVATTGLVDKDWVFLPKLKSLKSLMTGRRLRLTDSFLDYVAQNKSLERLDVRGPTEFSNEAFARLVALRNLKALSIRSPQWTDKGMKVLAEMSDLEELHLGGEKLTAKSIEHLRSLQKLRELSLSLEHIPKSNMETIAGLKHLEKLSLHDAKIGDEEVAVFAGHPSLKRLLLNSARVSQRSLAILKSLEKLEVVSLGGNEESRQIEEAINKRFR